MMKETRIQGVLQGNYYKALFLLSFGGAYFLIPPKVFYDGFTILAFAFMLTFAATFTCLLRNLKERIFAAKVASGSILGAIATVAGFSALQACSIGIPVCGATFGFMLLSAILPGVFINFLMDYSVAIVAFSMVLQLFALWQMGCFSKSDWSSKHSFYIPEK